jgi:hypothetical protein
MSTEKKKYLIYVFTYWCGITQFLIGAIVPVVILVNMGPAISLTITIIAVLLLNVIVWYFVRKYLLQPIEIVLTEERIYLKYLNQNLSKTKKEISTTFDKISQFSDFSDGRDLKFKLYFSQGQTFTLYKSGLWRRTDDFELLINDFRKLIEILNVKKMNDSHLSKKKKIKYGDNTYLNFSFIFFGFAFFCGLIFIISIFTKYEATNYKLLYGFLLLLGLGLLNYYIHRKANKM